MEEKIMKPITVKQLEKICSENKYIILRSGLGWKVGLNCKVASLAEVKRKINKDGQMIATTDSGKLLTISLD